MDQQKPAQRGQNGTGQTQQSYSNGQLQQQAYTQYSLDASAYYQQYQQYQQYYQYQQQQSMPTAAATTTAAAPSALPPSYSTPLPPPKSKKHQSGIKSTLNNPLSQIQAQYQSSMQIGAAAASALTSALLQFGYPAATSSGSTAATETTTASAMEVDASPQQLDWFSGYEPPTLQQRMAANSNQPQRGSQRGRRHNNSIPRQGQQQHQRQGRNNRNPHQQRQRQQQQQTEEPEAPAETDETSGLHCDACDVTFHEEAKLKTHIAAHRSCPDCQYQASPSLVSEHRKLTHGPKDESTVSSTSSASSSITTSAPTATAPSATSLLSAPDGRGLNPNRNQRPKPALNPDLLHPLAPVLNTPEDIDAWIAQRRKAWPTESNIKKKEQEKQEMIARGQIVDEPASNDPYGRDKRKKKSADNNRNNNRRGQRQPAITEAECSPTKKAKIEGDTSESADITMDEAPTVSQPEGAGLVAYMSSVNPSEEDEDGDEDDNEDMDPVKDAITSKDPSAIGKVLLPSDRPRKPTKPCKFFLRNACSKGDKCTYLHDAQHAAKVQRSRQATQSEEVFRTRPSLLQM
ncbi:hypothetical protein BGZ51_004029, partial [Haplosporangium sp. Z 767]